MDYVKKFLHIEGLLGHGSFGQVYMASVLNPITDATNKPQPAICSAQESAKKNISLHISDQSGDLKSISSHKQTSNTATRNTKFALKCIHPILKPSRLANELRILRDIGGRENVVGLRSAHFEAGSLYIVMELLVHDRFVDIVSKLTNQEVKLYMKNLLIALRHVHKHKVIHRDIKPANFLYNRRAGKFLLVDFGLAQTIVRPIMPPNGISKELKANTPSRVTIRDKDSISSYTNASPKTPTRQPNFSINGLAKTQFRDKSPFQQSTVIKGLQSPGRLFNLTPLKGPAKNHSASHKRQLTDQTTTNDFDQNFKRLRVSNNDETREPVKLTVGAYESPVTDNSFKRQNINQHQFSTPKPMTRTRVDYGCDCFGKAKTCSVCTGKHDPTAPKSGTPGFKAPEILFRSVYQTSAIDIWSAGVIFGCLLLGHSPFFRDADDGNSLSEVISIFGSQKMIEVASACGARLTISEERAPVDLVQICKTIRANMKRPIEQPEIEHEAYDLFLRMLDPNPRTRITAEDALLHSWFKVD